MIQKKISAASSTTAESDEDDDSTCLGDSCCTHQEAPCSCLKKTHRISSTSSSAIKVVSFGFVHVREFPVCVGDNPSVSAGAPISIDWDPISEHTYGVSEYYDMTHYSLIRTARAQTFTALQRYCILLQAGYTTGMIMQGERAAQRSKRDRALTIERFHMDFFEETLERVGRSARNAVFGRHKKRQQRELLQKCLESDKASLTARENIDPKFCSVASATA